MPRWLKLQPQWVDHDYTLDTITPSASSVARHTHITQPCRARGDGLSAFPRRALRLGVAKPRGDALTEPRILLRLRGGAAGDKLLRPRVDKRDVAAELSQKRRAHAFDDGTHTLSRAAAITDSRRGLHSARALRIAVL